MQSCHVGCHHETVDVCIYIYMGLFSDVSSWIIKSRSGKIDFLRFWLQNVQSKSCLAVVRWITHTHTHTHTLALSRSALRLAGSGEAHPPHAVRAVHRVPGAPFSPAAQQQCGESRGGGAACLHPGSHQTARLLLQVRTHSSRSFP